MNIFKYDTFTYLYSTVHHSLLLVGIIWLFHHVWFMIVKDMDCSPPSAGKIMPLVNNISLSGERISCGSFSSLLHETISTHEMAINHKEICRLTFFIIRIFMAIVDSES